MSVKAITYYLAEKIILIQMSEFSEYFQAINIININSLTFVLILAIQSCLSVA